MNRTRTLPQLFAFASAALALVLVLALLAWLPQGAAAQTTTSGDVTGTVTDPSGAAIPGATVTLTNSATGAHQTVTTSAQGNYRFALLRPGRYVVGATATGFSPKKLGVSIAVGQVQTANLRLAVGAATQTVTVTGEAAPTQTTNANLSTSFTPQQVSQLPNGGGDLTAIVQSTPGAVMNTQMGYGNFSTYGLGGTANLFTINGMNNNDPFLNLNNSGATNLLLGQNDVQTVTVVNNGYSGQYGGFAGANVNYVTKSGSNDWHGNANYFWNGRTMNANSFFNNSFGVPRPFVNANQWSASIGGPIVKDKTFFFVDTEGLDVVLPTGVQAKIPSPQFQTATLANLAATGQSAQLPFYQTMFSLYNGAQNASFAVPVPGGGCGTFTGLGTAPCALEFQSTSGNHTHEWNIAARVDQNLGSSDHMFFQFSTDHGVQATFTDPINPGFNIQSTQPQYQAQLNWTHSFSANATNQFVGSGSHYSAIFGEDPAARAALFPAQLDITGGLFTNLGGIDSSFPQGRNVNQFGVVDDVAVVKGDHSIKFGVSYNLNFINDFDFGIGTTPLATTSLDSLFAGTADVFSQSFPTSLNQPIRVYQLGGYIEDDVRVTPSLHVTAALRVDHYSNPVCVHNCISRLIEPFTGLTHDVTVPYNQVIQTGLQQTLPAIQSVLWQPRLGIAWQPFGTQNTVLRGGVGLFSNTAPAVLADSFAGNAPVVNSFTLSGPFAPVAPNNVFNTAAASNTAFINGFASGGTLASITATTPGFAPPNYFTSDALVKSPHVVEWNLELQQAVGTTSAFSVNYVGNHGYHEPIQVDGFNAFSAGFVGLPATVPDGRFGVITQLVSGANSNYNGLTVSFQRKLSRSFQFQANYTWSHAQDWVSNGGFLPFNLNTNSSILGAQDPYSIRQFNYGNADYDVRNYFSLNYVWQVPFSDKFHFGPDQLWRGWTVSGTLYTRSGLPLTVIDGGATTTLEGSNYGPLGEIFSTPLTANGQNSNCGINNTCLNAAAFTPSNPAPTGFGDQIRNQYRGPGFFDTDMSIVKDTQIPGWEHATLGIGFEFFNLLNHPNFDEPVGDVANSSQFGTVINTAPVPTSILGSFLGGDASPRIIAITGRLVF